MRLQQNIAKKKCDSGLFKVYRRLVLKSACKAALFIEKLKMRKQKTVDPAMQDKHFGLATLPHKLASVPTLLLQCSKGQLTLDTGRCDNVFGFVSMQEPLNRTGKPLNYHLGELNAAKHSFDITNL